jgi:flavin-binding protein dodecin
VAAQETSSQWAFTRAANTRGSAAGFGTRPVAPEALHLTNRAITRRLVFTGNRLLVQRLRARKQEVLMSVAKVVELTAESESSFEDAIRQGLQRASQTIKNIEGAWIKEQKVRINNGKIIGYRVDMKVTFVLNE